MAAQLLTVLLVQRLQLLLNLCLTLLGILLLIVLLLGVLLLIVLLLAIRRLTIPWPALLIRLAALGRIAGLLRVVAVKLLRTDIV